MDEPVEEPEPPANLPQPIVEEIPSLGPDELRLLIDYARSRLELLETPVSELIEPDEDEEILRIEERDIYTVVVKRQRCEDGCDDCPHEPHAYVVTKVPDLEGGRRLRWVDIGEVNE